MTDYIDGVDKTEVIMSVISMKQLLEAGVHFGHQTQKWNPKMKKFIFTSRNNVHILNLEQTTVLIDKAYQFVRDQVAAGKKVLFVGTKKQAEEATKTESLAIDPAASLKRMVPLPVSAEGKAIASISRALPKKP